MADLNRTSFTRWRNKTVCFLAFLTLGVFSLQVSAQIDPNDLDGDGIVNAVDIDDDNDGILDTDEGCVALALPAIPGTTMFGVPDSFSGPGFFQVISDSDVDGDGINDPGQLFVYDPVNSQYTLIGGPEEINYNAIGYNVNDGFIYGIARAAGTDALGNAVAQWDVVRVDADGEVFFHVTPTETITSFSADVTVLPADFNDDTTANFIAAGTEVLTGFIGGDLFAIDLATGNTVRLNNNGTTPARQLN